MDIRNTCNEVDRQQLLQSFQVARPLLGTTQFSWLIALNKCATSEGTRRILSTARGIPQIGQKNQPHVCHSVGQTCRTWWTKAIAPTRTQMTWSLPLTLITDHLFDASRAWEGYAEGINPTLNPIKLQFCGPDDHGTLAATSKHGFVPVGSPIARSSHLHAQPQL